MKDPGVRPEVLRRETCSGVDRYRYYFANLRAAFEEVYSVASDIEAAVGLGPWSGRPNTSEDGSVGRFGRKACLIAIRDSPVSRSNTISRRPGCHPRSHNRSLPEQAPARYNYSCSGSAPLAGFEVTKYGRFSGDHRGEAPSNYRLAISIRMIQLLDPLTESVPYIHFNRGDGDGCVNLVS